MTFRSRSRRRRPKKISLQGLTGQSGVNLIEGIVLKMGCRWTQSGAIEVGIDGYIELFDPSSHEPLGLTLAVQSKVDNPTISKPGSSFDYWCSPNDVEYWLNGNTPVILVVSSTVSNEAYWISIKDHFGGWTPKDSARITFSKDRDRFTPDSFRQLIEIAAPNPGLYLAPARRRETLYSNLLLLENLPSQIFIGVTDCRTPREVWASLRKTGREPNDGWLLWEKKIFSFHDLGEEPWVSACDIGTVEPLPTSEWSASEDADRRRIFVQLLNQTLKAQLRPGVRYWPREDCYAMGGRPRRMSYQSLKRSSQISVVSRYIRTAKDGRRFEWLRHLAFRGQFRLIEDQWYLEITPTYRFTRDGFALDRFHEERLKGIKQIEGNRAVLSSVLFWVDYLRPKSTPLFHGPNPLLKFGQLHTFGCEVGIIDREWLAVDPDSARGRAIKRQIPLLGDPEDGDDL